MLMVKLIFKIDSGAGCGRDRVVWRLRGSEGYKKDQLNAATSEDPASLRLKDQKKKELADRDQLLRPTMVQFGFQMKHEWDVKDKAFAHLVSNKDPPVPNTDPPVPNEKKEGAVNCYISLHPNKKKKHFPMLHGFIRVQRRPRYYVVNVALPIWIFTGLGLLQFAIDPIDDVGERLTVSLTMLLTTAAYKARATPQRAAQGDDVHNVHTTRIRIPCTPRAHLAARLSHPIVVSALACTMTGGGRIDDPQSLVRHDDGQLPPVQRPLAVRHLDLWRHRPGAQFARSIASDLRRLLFAVHEML